jgi:hypothetical protein
VELTPEREYLLVTEFFDGAVELGDAEVDEQIIDDGLGIVRRLWDAGLAHRDIKPANLLVRDGRMLLIDVAFVESRPTPWRQAVDLANMMLCLALRSSPDQVYRRAQLQFNTQEITEGFAAARGLALPSQLRRMLREKGRDLHAEFVRLLPSPPHPIRIQRWSVRRIGLLALVALLAALVGSNIVQNVTNNEAGATPLYIGSLACTDLEPQWLEAQSVPSASLVPCLRSLPTGWTLSNVTVNNGRSVLTLDNDRAGMGAMVVRLAATCDPAGASQVLSDQPGARRLMLIQDLAPRFSATRFDVFAGGCVTTRLTVPVASRAAVTSEASLILGFTTRETLRQTLEERSDGRLQLDPGQAR